MKKTKTFWHPWRKSATALTGCVEICPICLRGNYKNLVLHVKKSHRGWREA